MCVCMYACMHAFQISSKRKIKSLRIRCRHKCVCMHACMHVKHLEYMHSFHTIMNKYIHTYTRTHIHTHIREHTGNGVPRVATNTCIYTHIHTRVRKYTHTQRKWSHACAKFKNNEYMHIYIYIYTHTHTGNGVTHVRSSKATNTH
jgi:hypothetical protein